MADPTQDIFAEFRTNRPARVNPTPAPSAPAAPQEQSQDIFAEFRVDQRAPQIRRENNTLGEEFVAGLGSGIDSMQGSLYGVAGLMGRELGIGWMEQAGNEGAARNFQEASERGRQSGGFTEIESAGGFFRWGAASIGEAIPSLAAAMSGGGVGAVAGKKAVELAVKKSLAKSVERRLVGRYGFDRASALESARDYMLSDAGRTALTRALTGERTGAIINAARVSAGRKGAAAGAMAVSALPQIGAIDQELLRSGVADPGLTALVGGVIGGALEAVPALRLLDKMFPGVDRQVSKTFVKDFAISTGTQAALEGSTEAAQEIIQLAALAYKDPTFDMFSPDAKRRVIDAFAAGALVGAVTGGGAEGVGAVQSGAFAGAKAAAPKFKAWALSAQDMMEDALPEGFVEADRTVLQEVQARVYGAVQPQVDAAINSLQAQVQKITDTLNENLEGGVNAESAKIADVAKAAHNRFLEQHGDQLNQLKAYLDEKVKSTAQALKEIKDPEGRSKFVERQVADVKEKTAGFVDMIRRAAAKRDQETTAEVDNMDFDDDMLAELGFEEQVEETETRVGPSGRTFERAVGPEVQQESSVVQKEGTINTGETEAAPQMTFGFMQQTPAIDESGKETVRPYKSKKDAEKGRTQLKKKFPNANNDAFRIEKHPDGTGYVIQAIDPAMRDDFKFFQDFDAARSSATRRKNNPRKVVLKGVDGSRFGYGFKNLALDVQTMAYRGKNLDPQAKTMQQGFRAFAGELLARRIIDNQQFAELDAAATQVLGKEKDADIAAFAEPPKFATRGVAMHVMIKFKEYLADKGIETPRNLFDVESNDDGTYSFGFNRDKPGLIRAFRAKDPEQFGRIMDELKQFRRDEQLDRAAQDAGEFSGNITLDATGELADTRGDTAGTARIVTDPIRTGRTGEGKRTATRTKTGGLSPEGRSAATTVDSDPQADDRMTDPKAQPSEFDTRHKRFDPELGKVDKRKRDNAKELSNHDKKILARYGRPGKFKMLTAPNMSLEVQSVLNSIGHFVTKKLGLSNQVTFVDDHGLSLLIEQGLVSDPIFEQTLTDPSVNARNIRIGDNSFIYLSQRVLSDPAATVLAYSHEMGHHLYRVAWDKLTPEGQQRLRKAAAKDGAKTDAEFNEWMGDQLAAWIARPIREGGDPGKFFFQKVAQNIRKLYNFVANNKRFQLNETFKEFADAVALKAATQTSQKANPFNDAILKKWFQNEGVTMYQWFGDALESDNMDFAPVTAEGKKALARMEKNFPAIAKRAITLRNWIVSAYKMAVGPSTSAIRSLPYKSAQKLVVMFNRQAHGEAKQGQNYHQAVNLMKGQFMDQYRAITKQVEAKIVEGRPELKRKSLGSNKELNTLVNAEMREIGKSLQQKDGNPAAEFTPLEQQIRNLFDEMHAYAIKAGLPVGKVPNYYPRSLSRELLIAGKQKILDHLTDSTGKKGMPLEKARHLYNSLIDPSANDGRATRDATETPGFKAMNSRAVQDKFFDQFLDTNTDGVVANYVNQVVKRAEFNRRLGEAMPATELSAKQAIKEGVWDPKGKMHRLIADAKAEGASDQELVMMEKYIDANLGQLGRDDIKPGMRRFMAGVMAYQNMRVLLFTVFASLPDLAGPAIRSGDMKLTWNVLKKSIHEMATDSNKLAEMARAYGIISDTMNDHIMTEYVDNHYMPAKMRQWNDGFFKWTGLNWYTDFTRKYALAVGIDYIQQQAELMESSDSKTHARARDMLAELGITALDVKAWNLAGRPTALSHSSNGLVTDASVRKVAEALVQFVDESIMRPNASQRPILASHPAAMLVYHLKGYMYAVHDIILKRIKFNIDEAESPAQYAAAIAPAIAMMLLTAVGLELRELIQYAGSNRKPPTDRMDGWEYTFELMQRSGLTGFGQIGFDLQGAEDRGMSHVAGIGGPTLSQAAEVISRPSTQTIPKSIPIIGQIPAARDMVRAVL